MLKRWFGADRWMWNHMINTVFNENFDRKKLSSYNLRDDMLNNGPEFINRKTRKYIPDSSVDCCAVRFMTAYKLYTEAIKKSKNTKYWTNVDKYKPKYKTKKEKSDICILSKKSDKFFTLDNGHINIRTTKFYKRQTFKTRKPIDIPVDDIKMCIFHKVNDKYYIIFQYETQVKDTGIKDKTIGIDTGMKTTLTMYDGKTFKKASVPTKIYKLNKEIAEIDSKLANKAYASKRYFKLLERSRKKYKYKTNLIRDFYNKNISYIIKNYDTINIDKFNIKADKKDFKDINRKKISVGVGYFIERLIEKSEIYSNLKVNIVPRGTPTTQTCSNCGNVKTKENKLTLNDRTYECSCCGFKEDRDVNAAINVYKMNL